MNDKLKNRLYKLLKLPLRCVWKLCNLLPAPKYRPKKYWKNRHTKYGFNLRGVGNCTFSHEENKQAYQKAKEAFLQLCTQQDIDFKNVRALDIGCGTGFYAKAFLEAGGRDYLGIDITDQLFKKLQAERPDCKFRKMDISTQSLDGLFDLIIMIDVTQHIVDDAAFSFTMQNIRSHLSEDGVFIVTSWLSNRLIKRSYYEVARPISYYNKEFPDFGFSESVAFRDKFIFAIRKPPPNATTPERITMAF